MLTQMENKLVWKVTLINRNELTSDTEVDIHDMNDYAKYVFSLTAREYEISADGADAGEIRRESDGRNNEWVSSSGHGNDLRDTFRTFGIELGINEKYGQSQMHDVERNITTYKKIYDPDPEDESAIIEKEIMYIATSSDYSAYPKAVSVHANMTEVYDYYKDILKRNSYDNKNSEIRIYTDHKEYNELSWTYENYNNACWDPNNRVFLFGDTGTAIQN